MNNTVVENVIVCEPAKISELGPRLPYDLILALPDVTPRPGIGWTYENGVWTPPVTE